MSGRQFRRPDRSVERRTNSMKATGRFRPLFLGLPRTAPASPRHVAAPFAGLLAQQRGAAAPAEAPPQAEGLVEIGAAARSAVPEDPAPNENGATPIQGATATSRPNAR